MSPQTSLPAAPGAPSHTFGEHTGEVELRLRAPTLGELFAQAGLGLAELMTGALPASGPPADEPVALQEQDAEALLVAWLDELIFRTERRGRPYTAFRIEHVADGRLRARIGAAPVPLRGTPVKAATFHRLQIVEDAGGFAAAVVLDV